MPAASADSDLSGLGARRARRRTTPSRGLLREQAILDAAETLLGAHSFADLTVDRVAAAAGISRPTVYFYFASVQDLVEAIIGRHIEATISALESIGAPPDGPAVEVLRAGLDQTRELWRTRTTLQRLAVDHAHDTPTLRGAWQALLDRGATLYLALMAMAATAQGRPPAADAEARRHAELFMLTVGHGFYELFQRDHTDTEENQLIDDLLTLGTRALQLEM